MAACSIPANFFPVKWDWDLRDFCLVMDGISEIVPATSKDFRRFSEDFRKRPKMFRRTLTTSEAIWLKDDNLSVFWFRWDMQSHHSMPYWNIFMEIELNFRRLFGFVSQTWEKFSLIREIDIFSLQAWDSRIRAWTLNVNPFAWGRRAKSWWRTLTYRWYQVLRRQWRRWLPQIRYDDLWYVSYFVAFLLTDKCFLRFSNSSWREHRLTVCYACFFNYFTHWSVL